MNPNKIYEKALELLVTLDASFLELGKILRLAQDEDPALFQQLLKIPGLGRRRCYHLVKIDRTFEGYEVDKEILIAIGWTKLSIIAPHVSHETIGLLLALAQSVKAHTLTAMVKGEVPTKSVQLFFKPEQYSAYVKALLGHGAVKKGDRLQKQEEAILHLIETSYVK